MDVESSSISSREVSPRRSNGVRSNSAYTSRMNSTDARQGELQQHTVTTVSGDHESVGDHCPPGEDVINQEMAICESGQNETQTEPREQVTPPSSSETQRLHNNIHEDRHRPIRSAGERDTHHSDSEPDVTGDTSTSNRRRGKGALMCMTLTRITALVVLAIVIAGVFSVPIILFVIKTNEDRVSGSHLNFLQSQFQNTASTFIVQAPPAAECSAEVYTGEVCQSVLAARQSCILGRENSAEVFVTQTQPLQVLVEQELVGLQVIPLSPDCEGELLSFLCVEAFGGFCDGTGTVHRTTRQECERITTTVCAAEFEIILPLLESRGFETSCDAFPESSGLCTSKLRLHDTHSYTISLIFCVNIAHQCMASVFVHKTEL